ncbi:MAG: GAF domain-containing protein [Nitrospirae bacterium]|nr:GAF domain-containing protein [Nitrospirota bacterium]
MEQLYIETGRFFNILNTILSTLDINEILTTVVKEIQSILNADRCTLYLISKERNELYSKVLQADNLVEIRVPIMKSSLAGYSAATGKIINIKDAYDDSELKGIDSELSFNKTWDQKSGYRTRSVLVVPIPIKSGTDIVGVFQALNKPAGFSDSDVNIMNQLAYLLGIAVNNALLYQTIEEEKKLREYIIDDIEEGICILDTKKRIVSANKFLEVMSGMRYSTEGMLGADFFDLFPSFTATELEEKINEVFQNGFKKIAQLAVLEIKIIPYLDEKGKVKRLILIFTRF